MDVVAAVVGFGNARDVRLVGVAGEGELVSGPLVEIIGRCIVKRLAFLM